MTNVYAETYNGGFGDGDVIETKVYVNKREPSGYMRWQRVHTIINYEKRNCYIFFSFLCVGCCNSYIDKINLRKLSNIQTDL